MKNRTNPSTQQAIVIATQAARDRVSIFRNQQTIIRLMLLYDTTLKLIMRIYYPFQGYVYYLLREIDIII